MLTAAVQYYLHATGQFLAMRDDGAPLGWPWEPSWWKPKGARRDLVRAAALCLAEIDRIKRRAASARLMTARIRLQSKNSGYVGHVEQKLGLIRAALAALDVSVPA